MIKKNSRLVFFGNERLATGVTTAGPVFSSLLDANYDIAALVINQQTVSSRSDRNPEIVNIAQAHNIPVITFSNSDETIQQLLDLDAQAGVLVAFGRLVPQNLIDIFPSGVINLHPSLLPLYRGSTPIEQVILEGQTETGVSLMKLANSMDVGPIFAQTPTKIASDTSKQDLADKLSNVGRDLLIEKLPDILSGSLKPVSQNNKLASYTQLIDKNSGLIDQTKSAVRLEREVRAYLGWPKSHINLFGHEIIITKAQLVKNDDLSGLILKCNPGWLEIVELIAPSGRKMSGADFMHGYKRN